MHNGFLQVEGRKMAKSEGNFVTINELLNTEKFGGRKWSGEVLRLAMLMTHYREPIDFSVRKLEEANAISLGWHTLARRFASDEGTVLPDVLDALRDDLNTPLAIQAIQRARGELADIAASLRLLNLLDARIVAIAEQVRSEQRAGIAESVVNAEEAVSLRELGLDRAEVEAKRDQRLAFILEKNWAEADKIRDELLAQGIQLKDGKDPATGERVTTWEVKR
jgi:cysteinyl-tRNA synthetase